MHGKLFPSTYTGSLFGQGDLLILWPYVIANTGEDHRVVLNPEKVAETLGITVEAVNRAIERLCAEDKASRSVEQQGRRLIKSSDFTYFVVTHERYGQIKNEKQLRDYYRVAQQRSRAAKTEPENEKPAEPKQPATPKPAPTTPAEEPDPNVFPIRVASPVVAESAFEPITLQQAIDQSAFKAVDPKFARYVYDDWVSRGGRDGSGVQVSWIRYVSKRWDREGSQWQSGSHRGNPKGNGSTEQKPSRYSAPLHIQLKAIQEQIDRSPANRESVFYNQNATELERGSLRLLKQRRQEISKQIALGTNTEQPPQQPKKNL